MVVVRVAVQHIVEHATGDGTQSVGGGVQYRPLTKITNLTGITCSRGTCV